ncbi:peptidylprolyl isomerase [Myxococcota bacterium]|nr:peptidylprolyl isomerase [Myxococcota bacterium]MBU1430686.1 peptidylprolyl isomerase [Myxococcota bacterium]MBU1899484.1 peptidylprolyl isomerase [Myxococcota bacterium]
MTISKHTVVAFNYVLRDGEGKILDDSEGNPLEYLQGAGNIVPGLERQMEGHQAGDAFEAIVAPAEGYGERKNIPIQSVPREAFKGIPHLREGMQFNTRGADGELTPIWVHKVEEDVVLIDANHPLAGVTLHFNVEIAHVREANPHEVEHGHPSCSGCAGGGCHA